MRMRSSVWVWAFGLATALAGGLACAQNSHEPDVKARIVYRVLLFVSWPSQRLPAGQPFDLCHFRDDALSAALLRLAGQSVHGHALQVRKVTPSQIASCHAVYIGEQAPAALAAAAQPDAGVLLIGDRLGLIEQGVMLNLHTDGGRVAFDIGLAAARRAGLQFSAKLLRLARFVMDR